MGGLSTHVLDLTQGRPGAGMAVTLRRGGDTVFEGKTDADGRCAGLLAGTPFSAGGYELVFSVGPYFRARDPDAAVFFEEVTVAFTVSAPDEHHHVPLLVTPHSYSTYRGS